MNRDAHAIETVYGIEYAQDIGVLLFTISRKRIRYVPIVYRIDVTVVRMVRSHRPINDYGDGFSDVVGCLHRIGPH